MMQDFHSELGDPSWAPWAPWETSESSEDLGPGLCCPPWDPDALLLFEPNREVVDEVAEPKPRPKLKTRSRAKVAKVAKCKVEMEAEPVEMNIEVAGEVMGCKKRRKNASSKVTPELRSVLDSERMRLPQHARCPLCGEFRRTRFYDFNNYRVNHPRYWCYVCSKQWSVNKKK